MAAPRERTMLYVSLILSVFLGAGCNVLSLPYFLAAPEEKKAPECKKLASEDKEKTVKVMILTFANIEARPELVRMDRDLTAAVARHLEEGFKGNKEKVTIISPRQVDRYKDEHPGWKNLHPVEIGRKFDADYVVSLEINSLGLFEMGSSNQLYRGRASISVDLVNMAKSEDAHVHKDFDFHYPSDAKGPIPVGDSSPQQFRQAFLDYLGERLSWCFTAHPAENERQID
jgi:hypothetical protein